MKNFLKKLAERITGKPRETIRLGRDFEWSKDSWVHNIFRSFEVLFGRKSGLRPENATIMVKDWDGNVFVEKRFYTFESVLAQVETVISCLLYTSPSPRD